MHISHCLLLMSTLIELAVCLINHTFDPNVKLARSLRPYNRRLRQTANLRRLSFDITIYSEDQKRRTETL